MADMVTERDRRMTIRLSEEELAMLQALADADGVTVSDYVRLAGRHAYAERFGAKRPKKK
jgi:uncharacterized protein (DUF1778 family)